MPGRIREAIADTVGCIGLMCVAAFGGELIVWVTSWL
jgi:hypothetical protein